MSWTIIKTLKTSAILLDTSKFSNGLHVSTMKLYMTVFVITISICIVNASLLDPVVENVVHIKASSSPNGAPGTWKKKTVWMPRWVKEWKSAKVMKPSYKKVWSPVFIKEWIPFPKLPPKWDVKSKPAIQETNEPLPLWDPMPYPESQQPPPVKLSFSLPPSSLALNPGHSMNPGRLSRPTGFSDSFNKNSNNCHHGKCENPSFLTFTQDQISQIIGHSRHKKETDFSISSENHTEIEPSSNETSKFLRPRRQSFLGLNLLQGLSQFLMPPMFSGLNHLSKPMGFSQPQKKFNINNQSSHPPNRISQNGQPQLYPQTKAKQSIKTSHFLNSPQSFRNSSLNYTEHPYKFENTNFRPNKVFLSPKNGKKENTNNNNQQSYQSYHNISNQNPNLIQPAKLIGEYHYSEFDFMRPGKPMQFHEEVKFKPLPASMWSFSAEEDGKLGKPLQSTLNARSRPIRKGIEHVDNQSNIIQEPILSTSSKSFSVTTSSTFEQQKATTKENFPPRDIALESQPNTKFEKKNLTMVNDGGLPEAVNTSEKIISESQAMQPVRLSEEALLNALIKNHGSPKITAPVTSSSSSYLISTTEALATRSYPVYIVTPTNLSQKQEEGKKS